MSFIQCGLYQRFLHWVRGEGGRWEVSFIQCGLYQKFLHWVRGEGRGWEVGGVLYSVWPLSEVPSLGEG